MEVHEPDSQRFDLALELLREGGSLTFRGVSFRVSPDGDLDIDVDSSWRIENTTENTALEDLKRARNVLADLIRESPSFREIVNGRRQRFSLNYFNGRDGVLLGHYVDGKIDWVK